MDDIDKKELLKENLPFFNKLTSDEINKLIHKSSIIKYKKGELVYSENSTCTGVLVNIYGQFRIFISSQSGREITLFKLLDRDICVLSASCVFKNITYDINLEAELDSLAIIIDSAFIKSLSDNNSYVLNFLLNLTQDKLSETLSLIERTIFLSLENRVANFLISEYNLTNSDIIYVTHENIANNLGSAREAVSRILKKFEKENLLKISRGKIKLLDINGLENVL
ncbi:Crp/Fnr family transcriptional regulator [[Clostridium] dakarense]|uniref:Crp/Fnr family transcriptional regulator n=1 Tax=Faecalimicrobium dakarense TaxID=1301100 RepID=UPI0004B78483|nr:Crp/Fnr family transcriptional regulator [[Clostridium] dakarense]